ARAGVADGAGRAGRPAAAAVERIVSVRDGAGPAGAHRGPGGAARGAGSGVADLAQLADGRAVAAVAAVRRHTGAVAAEQPGLALTGAALTRLSGGAGLAARTAVLRIGRRVHALRTAGGLPRAAGRPAAARARSRRG